MEKGESGGVAIIPKIGMEVEQYYTILSYITPRTQNNVNSKDIMIVADTGINFSPTFFSKGSGRRKLGRTPPHMLF